MSPSAGTVPPPVSWAQRNDILYVIIDVECNDIQHSVTENTLTFKGTNALDVSKKYEVTLNFLHPIRPDKVTSKNIGRCLEFTVYKKEAGPYWPSLTNDKTKLHFLKANFSKWKNESDDEDDMGSRSVMLNDMFKDSALNENFEDFNVYDDDDSDDNIPSLSQNDDDDENNKKNKVKDEK